MLQVNNTRRREISFLQTNLGHSALMNESRSTLQRWLRTYFSSIRFNGIKTSIINCVIKCQQLNRLDFYIVLCLNKICQDGIA